MKKREEGNEKRADKKWKINNEERREGDKIGKDYRKNNIPHEI